MGRGGPVRMRRQRRDARQESAAGELLRRAMLRTHRPVRPGPMPNATAAGSRPARGGRNGFQEVALLHEVGNGRRRRLGENPEHAPGSCFSCIDDGVAREAVESPWSPNRTDVRGDGRRCASMPNRYRSRASTHPARRLAGEAGRSGPSRRPQAVSCVAMSETATRNSAIAPDPAPAQAGSARCSRPRSWRLTPTYPRTTAARPGGTASTSPMIRDQGAEQRDQAEERGEVPGERRPRRGARASSMLASWGVCDVARVSAPARAPAGHCAGARPPEVRQRVLALAGRARGTWESSALRGDEQVRRGIPDAGKGRR